MIKLYSNYILVFIFLICSISNTFAQMDSKAIDEANAETQRLTLLSQKLQGTYQMQIINSREKPTMPLSILDSVVVKRQKTETVYFWLKANTRIMVLPLDIITKKDFIPVERVAYIPLEEIK